MARRLLPPAHGRPRCPRAAGRPLPGACPPRTTCSWRLTAAWTPGRGEQPNHHRESKQAARLGVGAVPRASTTTPGRPATQAAALPDAIPRVRVRSRDGSGVLAARGTRRFVWGPRQGEPRGAEAKPARAPAPGGCDGGVPVPGRTWEPPRAPAGGAKVERETSLPLLSSASLQLNAVGDHEHPTACTRTIGGWEHTASTAHETGRLIHGTAAAVPPPPHAAGPWMHELVAQHNGVQASPPVTGTPPVAADTTAAFQAERAPSTTTGPTADATLVVASTTSGAVALAPSNASPAAALAASPTTGAAARMPSAMTGAAALAPSSASPAAARRPSPTTGAAARMPSAMTGAAAVPASTAA